MPAIALPLAPVVAPGLAQAATLAAGTAAYVAHQLYGFRAPLPPLPRTGGRAGQGTLGELVADAVLDGGVAVAKVFEAAVLLNGEVFSTGTGHSKKEAEQAAAGAALEKLQQA